MAISTNQKPTIYRSLYENTDPAYLADLLVRPKCSKYLGSTNSNRFVVPRIKTNSGSRTFSMSGPALWNALLVPWIRNVEKNSTFRKLLKSDLFDLAFPPYSSSVVLFPVDEPALASTMTHDHSEDLCASEPGPLRIYTLLKID